MSEQTPERRSETSKPVPILQARATSRSGPLPSAEELASYDAVVPGLAQTIVDMAKKEQDHRHTRENRLLAHMNRGQGVAITVFIIGFGVGLWCALSQQTTAAVTAFTVTGGQAIFAFLRLQRTGNNDKN